MALIEPLDSFFPDFGEEAIWKGSSTITVIFDKRFVMSGELVESTQPSVTVRASEVDGVAHEQTLQIRGVEYKIIGIEPDLNGGLVVLILEAQ